MTDTHQPDRLTDTTKGVARGAAMNSKPVRNRAQCRKCGDVIESLHVHDFRSCKCGAISVDGGKDYCRRVAFNLGDVIELGDSEPQAIVPQVITEICRG